MFRRTYFLPGPPKWFGADIETTSIVHDQSIASVRVLINNHLAISAGGQRTRIDPTDKKFPQLFRYGENTVEVQVIKRARNGSVGLCRAGNPPKPLGLRFRFNGIFEADLFLANPPFAKVQYFRVNDTTRQYTIHSARLYSPLRNLGPSGAYFATLDVAIEASSFPGFAVSSLSMSGSEMRGCQISRSGPSAQRIACKIERWARGRTPGITFKTNVDVRGLEDSDVRGIAFYGKVRTPTRDPNLANSSEYYTVYLCGRTATNPKCPP